MEDTRLWLVITKEGKWEWTAWGGKEKGRNGEKEGPRRVHPLVLVA